MVVKRATYEVARVWKGEVGETISIFDYLQVSPDPNMIVSVSSSGCEWVWSIPPQGWDDVVDMVIAKIDAGADPEADPDSLIDVVVFGVENTEYGCCHLYSYLLLTDANVELLDSLESQPVSSPNGEPSPSNQPSSPSEDYLACLGHRRGQTATAIVAGCSH